MKEGTPKDVSNKKEHKLLPGELYAEAVRLINCAKDVFAQLPEFQQAAARDFLFEKDRMHEPLRPIEFNKDLSDYSIALEKDPEPDSQKLNIFIEDKLRKTRRQINIEATKWSEGKIHGSIYCYSKTASEEKVESRDSRETIGVISKFLGELALSALASVRPPQAK